MQSPLCLEHRKHSIKINLSPSLFLTLPFLDSKHNKQKSSGFAKWQFQSVLCPGPFRFQNTPVPLLISVFLPSDVYLCVSVITHCCHSARRRRQQILLQQLIVQARLSIPSARMPLRPWRKRTLGQLYFKTLVALFTKRPFQKVSQQNINWWFCAKGSNRVVNGGRPHVQYRPRKALMSY